MMQTAQVFLLSEALVFGLAALVHFGWLVDGYQHREASIAETVIGAVLIAAFALTLIRPAASRLVGLGAQVFALFGTAVGVAMILIGVGPQSTLDLLIHGVMMTLLVVGIVSVWRRPIRLGL